MGENICKSYMDKGLISNRYKDLIQVNNNSIKRWAKKLNRFLQRRHPNDQRVYKMIVNIMNHQEKANQNHNETSPLTCSNGYYQKDKI